MKKKENPQLILVSGNARVGKDTFFNTLSNLLNDRINCNRFAFADQIKDDLSNLLMNNFNIDPHHPSEEQKEIIRPLLVSYGTDVARKLDPEFWIKKIYKKIEKNNSLTHNLCVITDARYPNEQTFFKKRFAKCISVHIERFGFGPANKEEEKNSPLLKAKSDYVISWETFNDNMDLAEPFVNGFINEKLKIR
jgi:hypothetical protein